MVPLGTHKAICSRWRRAFELAKDINTAQTDEKREIAEYRLAEELNMLWEVFNLGAAYHIERQKRHETGT